MSSSTLVCAVPAELPKASLTAGAITDALCGRNPEEPQTDQPVDQAASDADRRAAAKLTVIRPDRVATEAALAPPNVNAGGVVSRTGPLARTAVNPGAATPATAPAATSDPTNEPAWAEALTRARAVPRTRDVITTGDAEGLRKAMLAVIASDRQMQRYMNRHGMTADDLAGVFSRALFKSAVAGPNNQFAVPIPDNPGLIWEMSRHERREFRRSRQEASLAADAATVVAQTELGNLKASGLTDTEAVQHLAGEVRRAANQLHEFHRGGPRAADYPAFSRDNGGATADRAIRTAARDSGFERDAWDDPIYDDEPYESEFLESEPLPTESEAHVAQETARREAQTRDQRVAEARRAIEARREVVERRNLDNRDQRQRAEVFAALDRRERANTASLEGAFVRAPLRGPAMRRIV